MKNKKNSVLKFCPSALTMVLLIFLELLSNGTKIILALIYDNVLSDAAVISFNTLALVGGITIALIVLLGWINYVKDVWEKRSNQHILANIQDSVLKKTSNSSVTFIESIKEGNWSTILNDDANICAGAFSSFFAPFIKGGVMFACALGIGFFLSIKLALVVVACSAISGLLPPLFLRKIEEAQEDKLDAQEDAKDKIIKPLTHRDIISVYGFEDKFTSVFGKTYKKYADKCIQVEETYSIMDGVNTGVSFTVSTIWMIVGTFLMSKGELGVGTFAAFMMLNDYFSWPFTEMGGLLANRSKIIVSAERIEGFVDTEKTSLPEYTDDNDHLLISDARFSYGSDYTLKIDDLKCSLKNGSTTAIVGESGAGKSTFGRIISGAYVPASGNMELVYNHKLYRNMIAPEVIGYMPQGGFLINASIAENIRMGNPNATDEEIREVAEIVCLDEMVVELKDGYDTIVGKGSAVRLSGGQRARIALARVLIKKNPVYILDEFSASLDENLEERILANLKKLDSVFFFITHRDKTMDACSNVIRIDAANDDYEGHTFFADMKECGA